MYTDYNSDIKELDVFGQINLAFKIIEILGQITKNYYGSLDGNVKIDLLEETYNLGLRSLKKIMTVFNEYTGFFEQEISRIIQDKSFSEKERNALSKRLIFEFATLISLGFVTKVANSAASKELSAIYEAVYKKDPNISKQLVNIAIELDFPNGLDTGKIINLASEIRNNHIPSMLLKMLVIRHIYKFHIPYDKRQKICDKLNIGIEKQKKALSSVK
ncbi:hypothetical protein [Thioflexithrix psekupsensis]|uniref:Uncharacterized protein n=1 Tax=Thioflexithrix psekupsensis TaxID=1570016 RepID=A0A251X9A2_9GAMM|nr:hypothetical protein [Thioflexithrix psekupsensis]OUD14374.1 hypothetical protein TPSD3_08645 [Thioflexithrix psekupsensis]